MTRKPRCTPEITFPRPIHNRPGLPRIDYRIGGYAEIREKMFHDLNNDPVLAAWTHRGADDPGIALLEGAATLGDILTFYTNLYANEVYLRTATQRRSIAELVRLLDYRLAPGLGGGGTFAFEVKSDKPVSIPTGYPLKAKLQGADKPSDFQTLQDLTAHAALSKFHLYRAHRIPKIPAEANQLSVDTASLEQAGVKLAKKDRLLLLDSITSPVSEYSVVVIKEVETRFERTLITLDGPWKGGAGRSFVHAFKLNRTFRHFGHNAPYEVLRTGQVNKLLLDKAPKDKVAKKNNVENQDLGLKDFGFDFDKGYIIGEVINEVAFVSQIIPITYRRNLDKSTSGGAQTTVNPALGILQIPLDNDVDDLTLGGSIIISGLGTNTTVVREIKAFRSASMTWGSLSGAVTMVTLDTSLHDNKKIVTTDIRNMAIHEAVGSSFTLTAPREADPAQAKPIEMLWYFGDIADWNNLNERDLLIQGEKETVRTTASPGANPEPSGPALRPVILNPALPASFKLDDFSLDTPVTTVYGNIADADQGKDQGESVLGNGDGRRDFLTFKVPKAPLTWHRRSELSPPRAPELEVYVDRVLWTRVETLFGQERDAQIYIVREDDDGQSWIQFGDGRTGKRPPSGIKNITARYRTGSGAFGPLGEGEKVVTGARIDGLRNAFLPGVISGGSQPEDGESAREAAPGKVRALNRLVSIDDFQTEALSMPGVSRAHASWGLIGDSPGLSLVVLMDTGREKEFDAIRDAMIQADRDRGMRRFPIEVTEGKRLPVSLRIQVSYDPKLIRDDVDARIRATLGVAGEDDGLFHVMQRGFGMPEFVSRIEGTVHNVEGVQWTRVIKFFSFGFSKKPVFLKQLDCPMNRILELRGEDLVIEPVTGGKS